MGQWPGHMAKNGAQRAGRRHTVLLIQRSLLWPLQVLRLPIQETLRDTVAKLSVAMPPRNASLSRYSFAEKIKLLNRSDEQHDERLSADKGHDKVARIINFRLKMIIKSSRAPNESGKSLAF